MVLKKSGRPSIIFSHKITDPNLYKIKWSWSMSRKCIFLKSLTQSWWDQVALDYEILIWDLDKIKQSSWKCEIVLQNFLPMSPDLAEKKHPFYRASPKWGGGGTNAPRKASCPLPKLILTLSIFGAKTAVKNLQCPKESVFFSLEVLRDQIFLNLEYDMF